MARRLLPLSDEGGSTSIGGPVYEGRRRELRNESSEFGNPDGEEKYAYDLGNTNTLISQIRGWIRFSDRPDQSNLVPSSDGDLFTKPV